jgi:hypothetical protein
MFVPREGPTSTDGRTNSSYWEREQIFFSMPNVREIKKVCTFCLLK